MIFLVQPNMQPSTQSTQPVYGIVTLPHLQSQPGFSTSFSHQLQQLISHSQQEPARFAASNGVVENVGQSTTDSVVTQQALEKASATSGHSMHNGEAKDYTPQWIEYYRSKFGKRC